MHNSLIKKRLIAQPTNNRKRFTQNVYKTNPISQLLSRSAQTDSFLHSHSIDFAKLHPKSALHSNTLYCCKKEHNQQQLGKDLTSVRQLIRTKFNPKEELKPQQTSFELKQIQHKISHFLKNAPPSSTHNQSPHNQSPHNQPTNNQSPHKQSPHNQSPHNQSPPQNSISYSPTYLQKSKLTQILHNRHNLQPNPKYHSQYHHSQNNQNPQTQTSQSNWYLKAIQAHLKQTNQKIHLNYSTQTPFTTKTVHNQPQLTNTCYPKLSTGFKKRSVSYQVKYI